VSTFVAGLLCTGAIQGLAHCGTCGVEAEDHVHGLKEYKEGVCCSAEHYAEEQTKAIKAKSQESYKEGMCCSADHDAKQQVKAAKEATVKAKAMEEYKQGMCCSAEHYAKEKVAAMAKAKAEKKAE
jgi:hypothetical protein